MKKCFIRLLLIIFIFNSMSLCALEINGGHRGAITAFTKTKDGFISAGEDGYILIWDVNGKIPVVRFQLTTSKIEAVISHPLNEEICIIETGSPGDYRISAWNYAQKRKLFSVFCEEPISFINYSGNGNYIITSGLEESKLTLINSRTGEKIYSIDNPAGNTSCFAATGKAERNMLLYHNDGKIYYIDIQSGSVTGSLQAPQDLSNIIIFANNRFLAGAGPKGLNLIDAVTGETVDIMQNLKGSVMLCPSNEEFYCLTEKDKKFLLYNFSVNRNGNFEKKQELNLSFNTNRFQTRITEFAAGQEKIAFITENSELCIIPLDYRLLENSKTLPLKLKSGYSNITPVMHENKDKFILWQQVNNRNAPRIIFQNNNEIDESALNITASRFPLRAISSKNNNLLVLDAAGNLSTYNLLDLNAKPAFTFISAGAVDAQFINEENIILCRSASNNNSLFLSVNLKTTETLPVFFNAHAALALYSGKTGKIFAETVCMDDNKLKTTVIDLFSGPLMVYKYPAEANHLSITESSGNYAIACGSEGAFIFAEKTVNFERTSGLPVKLSGSDDFFLSLDSDGNIAWHNNKNGKLLAVFSLSGEKWMLKHDKEYSGSIVRF